MSQSKAKGSTGMLVLARKTGECVMIGDLIEVFVLKIENGVCRIGVRAPKHLPVHRREVYDRISQESKEKERREIRSVNQAVRNRKKRFLGLPRNVVRLGDRS